MATVSPFLEPGAQTSEDTLAIALLSRDNYEPTILHRSAGAVDGYAEGATLNTRFGSFPHSTLLDIPWGSQVRASAVDTGSRGRKRKRDGQDEDVSTPGPEEAPTPSPNQPAKKAVTASSGFIHVLRPTPELWTSSLPHRTQVVYTPDYSYILHRIRARPGTRIIEAGAGSGSFTHASARAVYNGYPEDPADMNGKVFSFEFNEPRYQKMAEEIKSHGLEGIVQITHRDVYGDGFLLDGESPKATAVFLDLPSPWKALHHLSRRRPRNPESETNGKQKGCWISPLDPEQTVHICSFSPCIEQVTRTVTELRRLGWTEIDMIQIMHRRFNVARDRVGLTMASKGSTQSPADVKEAVERLKTVNEKTQVFHRGQAQKGAASTEDVEMQSVEAAEVAGRPEKEPVGATNDEKPWLQGRLVHRGEAEIKAHTSYLVFALLPREWTADDEAAAAAKRPCKSGGGTIGKLDKSARKQQKRELLEEKARAKAAKKQKAP